VNEFDVAFAATVEQHLAALIVDGDNLFNAQRDQMAALAARCRIRRLTRPAFSPTPVA